MVWGIFLLVSQIAFALPGKLSQTGLYQDLPKKVLASTSRQYVPQYPLWSDGAVKERWISLPTNLRIDTADPDHWVFPNGTLIWKEFSFLIDGKIKRVETRIMQKLNDDWEFGSYLWDAEEKEAVLAPEEGVKNYLPTSQTTFHDIPSVTDCLKCHRKMGDPVLGFDALQLSTERDPFAPHAEKLHKESVTLKNLLDQGILTENHSALANGAPKIATQNPNTRAVFGYFHANCASCHNPVGTSMQMNLNFQYKLSAAQELEIPAYATSVEKRCQVFNFPGMPQTYRVKKGDLEKSALVYLMRQFEVTHMPSIGSKIIDQEALEKIMKWVRDL